VDILTGHSLSRGVQDAAKCIITVSGAVGGPIAVGFLLRRSTYILMDPRYDIYSIIDLHVRSNIYNPTTRSGLSHKGTTSHTSIIQSIE
jgi:hypothetical protein